MQLIHLNHLKYNMNKVYPDLREKCILKKYVFCLFIITFLILFNRKNINRIVFLDFIHQFKKQH